MARAKKENPIHFGIEVTKPHSKEMYTHNDKIAEELKSNILTIWKQEFAKIMEFYDVNAMADDWSEDDLKVRALKLLRLQRNVCYSGYGDGFTMNMVNEEFVNELENMPNYQIHEVYAYCCFESLVPRTKQGMVGFDWEKMNYWTDDIVEVKEVPGFEGTLDELNDITIMCSKELDNEWANESENPQ